MESSAPPVIFLMGPTASGKSGIALELADRLPLEIVNVDSASVYRGMDIGTAKPDAATRARYPHHLMDCIDPTQAYSAARFREEALAVMADIRQRGRTPLLVGGTMLYFKALRDGLDDLPPADPLVRAELDGEARARGWPALHQDLAQVDPVTAARLNPGDAQRIQRALEVFRIAGRPLSDYHGTASREPLGDRVLPLGLMPSERGHLHDRIAQRFDAMLTAGLEDELRSLRERHELRPDLPAMRAVGYRQMWEYLEGQCDLTTMRERGVVATRQLAKRQMTWLRHWPGLVVFDCLDPQVSRQVLEVSTAFLDASDP
ncbi:MAG: tRNA (adenosine(37)-N6)-dimethylallyltransferase MiaA [Betaproteobacteria bacterium]|nr:tRNA (adenosine(37)-N6)-dimethylallyltransferase MiaA [Betaproteobacteria bacterium]MDE2622176.1 tRNA (adenosine(37)-N6)-dimethylallyltransferase MiaA [Betaproteobacteria bacterium]